MNDELDEQQNRELDNRDEEIPLKALQGAIQELTHKLSEMIHIFASAAEKMALEEKEYESEKKKHDTIIVKLDKIIGQNKTIAEGLVAVADMVKENVPSEQKKPEESMQRPKFEPKPFERNFIQPPVQRSDPLMAGIPRQDPMSIMQRQYPMQRQESMMPRTQTPFMQQNMPPPPQMDFDLPSFTQKPQASPQQASDIDIPDDLFSMEEPKKKGIFGMFKK